MKLVSTKNRNPYKPVFRFPHALRTNKNKKALDSAENKRVDIYRPIGGN